VLNILGLTYNPLWLLCYFNCTIHLVLALWVPILSSRTAPHLIWRQDAAEISIKSWCLRSSSKRWFFLRCVGCRCCMSQGRQLGWDGCVIWIWATCCRRGRRLWVFCSISALRSCRMLIGWMGTWSYIGIGLERVHCFLVAENKRH